MPVIKGQITWPMISWFDIVKMYTKKKMLRETDASYTLGM